MKADIRRALAKTALAAVLTLVAACSSVFPVNDGRHTLDVRDNHPVAVDPGVVTLSIGIDPSVSGIPAIDRSRLHAFVSAYMNDGHGPLTISVPSGGVADAGGQELAARIRNALYEEGVPWTSMAGASYRVSGVQEGHFVVLSYTHYVATASECGIWTGEMEARNRRQHSPDFGCAVIGNIAAMVGDPRELREPAAVSDRDAALATRAIKLYRSGEQTSSAIDGDISATVE